MSHMVMFRNADGKPGYHRSESLDEAVAFVEQLPDQERVPETRIFRMEEVPIKVKTYYKIEVSDAPAPAPAPAVPPLVPPEAVSAAAPPAAKPAVPADEPVVVEVMAPAGGAAAPRFGRFNRS